MSRPDITLVSASAGSGKTFRLTEELLTALEGGARPEGILATTFTNKAASEITERVRLRLLENSRWDEAQRVLDGYIGTVNAICGRILQNFAFDAGLSPSLDVLPQGDDQIIYEKAISEVVERYAPQLEPPAWRMDVEDWRKSVKTISDFARSNGILPGDVKDSAAKSIKAFLALLPRTRGKLEGKALEQQLQAAVKKALPDLERSGDTTNVTAGVIKTLQGYARKFEGGEGLRWSDWAALSKLVPARKSQGIVVPVIEAALSHLVHPGFRRDIEAFISKIFECAAEAMQAYALYKAKHGLIDFVDQESLCLEILQRPEVRSVLKEGLDLVLVDEFQDTSPIQLAIFLQLAAIAPRAVWVGDQKQAIYGFRGTDSTMMDAVIENLIDPEKLDVLEKSYRSRPGLVAFTSALFAAAFEPMGIPRERVNLSAAKEDLEGQAHPLHVWHLMASNNDDEDRALALAVAEALQKPDDFLVRDRATEALRPLRGGDIAILCRRNQKCLQVAAALERLGVKATLPRDGLLSQPESSLALAGLRYLVSPSDSLAAAEIVHLTEEGSNGGDWFPQWLEARKGGDERPWRSHAVIRSLDEKRERLLHLTPCEALELSLSAVNVQKQSLRWGNGAQRLANIEKLRALARAYEDRCLVQRRAGTPAGLVTFFNEEKGGSDDKQAEGRDNNAVVVLTYHGAKGLEWPVVVLSELQSQERADPFGVHVHPSDTPFDPEHPLAGRWVRFWPWPYGQRRAVDAFAEAVASSAEQEMVAISEKKEMVRLLYVGMTRARDYLVFAPREKCRGVSPTAWLDSLLGKAGNQLLVLPKAAGERKVQVAGQDFPFVVSQFKPDDREAAREEERIYLSPTETRDQEFLPAQLVPSKLDFLVDTDALTLEVVRLGDLIRLKGHPEMNLLGEAIHTFFAADNPSWPTERRLDLAKSVMARWGTEGMEPQSLVTAADRLWAYLEKEYGEGITIHREWPVHMKIADQKAEGWIDLLVETTQGHVIIDHKSFIGTMDACREHAMHYAPQLHLYRRAMERATGRPVVDTVVHMPVAGVLMSIKGAR